MNFFSHPKLHPGDFPWFSQFSSFTTPGAMGNCCGQARKSDFPDVFFCFGFSDFVGMFQERGLIYIILASAMRRFLFCFVFFLLKIGTSNISSSSRFKKKEGRFETNLQLQPRRLSFFLWGTNLSDRQMRGHQWDWVCVVVSRPGEVGTSPWSSPSGSPKGDLYKKTVGFSGFPGWWKCFWPKPGGVPAVTEVEH